LRDLTTNRSEFGAAKRRRTTRLQAIGDIPGTSIDTISTKFSVGTGVTLRSRCDVASLGLNPWDVHSVDTVVAGGDRLHEVVGDKANALK
jgi:hypothetical protein